MSGLSQPIYGQRPDSTANVNSVLFVEMFPNTDLTRL